MVMTIVSYLVATGAALTFFHIFVHAFDRLSMSLVSTLARTYKNDKPLSQTWIFLQSAAKGFCTNVVASLIGIGIIQLFGKNYLAFPLVYFVIIVISEINLIKYCPPLRVKVEMFILLGNVVAIIGVYSVVWLI